jgi:hypothetical protein
MSTHTKHFRTLAHTTRTHAQRTQPPTRLKMRLVEAKSWICSRTTSMPRSSEAFNSSVMFLLLAPYSARERARMVLVLPVPGGP